MIETRAPFTNREIIRNGEGCVNPLPALTEFLGDRLPMLLGWWVFSGDQAVDVALCHEARVGQSNSRPG